MPVYEYQCATCGRRFTFFYRSFSQAERESPGARCPACGAAAVSRTVSKPTLLRGAEARLQALEDPSRLGALDAEDPRAMAGLLRDMSSALDEPLDEQTSEIIDRLDSGETPAQVGATLPEPDESPGGAGIPGL